MDTDEQLKQIPGEGSKSEFPDPERPKVKKPETLPPSNDKDFWMDDAEMNQIDKSRLQTTGVLGEHTLAMQGNTLICTSCPFPHTISYDQKHLRFEDGKLVKI